MPLTAALACIGLIAAAAQPTQASRTWSVDGLLLLSAGPPVSNRETTIQPWAGLRGAWLAPLGSDTSGLHLGVDASLLAAMPAGEGTPQVSSSRFAGGLEGRALIAPVRLASTFSALLPYGFVGLFLGAGAAQLAVFDEGRIKPLLTGSLRTGAGLELIVHGFTVRAELGAGMRDLRFDLTSGVGLGYAF